MHALRLIRVLAVTLVVAIGAAHGAFAGCPFYSVQPTAPSPMNWTNATGALWTPSGNYPGAGGCDNASNTNVPTTIVVDSIIPNGLASLNFNCAGCVIDIQTNGQLTLNGASSLSNGATIQLSGGTLVVNNTLSLSAGAQLHLVSGTVSGTGTVSVASDASILWDSTSSPTFDTLTVNNAGTFTLDPPDLASFNLVNNVALNNSGSMILDQYVTAINCGSASVISNTGLLRKTGGGMTTIYAAVNNVAGATTGVQVDNGVLALADGGQGDAPFTIAGDGVLEFPSAMYTMGTGGVVSGPGTLAISGGTLSIGGVTEPGGFTLSAGTLTGAGFLSVKSYLAWSGGTITGTGGTELAGNGIGDINGADGAMLLDGRTFNDYGYIEYTASTNFLGLDNGAILAVFGSFDLTCDGGILANDSASVINVSPNGQFGKTGGFGTSIISPQMNNTSVVFADAGTLRFDGDGTDDGTFFVGLDAQISFNASDRYIDGGFVGGDGTIAFTSGTTTVDAAYLTGNTIIESGADAEFYSDAATVDLEFNGGELYLGGTVFVMTGDGTWSGGTLTNGVGGGSFIVGSDATLEIDALNEDVTISATTLTNNGTINYTAGGFIIIGDGTGMAVDGSSGGVLDLADGATLDNYGTFDIQSDAAIAASIGGGFEGRGQATDEVVAEPVLPGSTFNNYGTGTLKKTASGGTTDFNPILYNEGTVLAANGTLHFADTYTQTSGTTTLGPGNIDTDGQIDISGGVLNGAGTIDGNLFNKGNVSPGTSPGTINVDGDYTQDPLGTLTIEIAGAAAGQFDVLAVTGSVTLNGTLAASLLSGYEPPNGTTFDVMTFGSRSGDFATYVPPTYPGGGSIQRNYAGNILQLSAVITPPSTDLSIDVTGPASVDAGAPLQYSVVVTNNGPDTTGGTTTVANTLPLGVTGAAGSGAGWSCGAPSGGVITCTNGDAVATGGAFGTLTFSMTAPANPGTITNSATVSSANDPNGGNNSDSVNTNVVAVTDLAIIKAGPNGVTAGQDVVYTITVTNNGPSQALGVTVADPLPANLTFVSNSGACTSPFPCSLGTLNSGASAVITSTYSTSPSFSGNVTNTATVSSTTNDPNAGNNSASKITNVGAQSDLNITKNGPSTANLGQDIVYTITFNNAGPSPATNVIISDPQPVGLAFISNTGACTTPFPCNIGTLAAGQSGSITSTYTVPANYSSASIVNTASISSDVNDPIGGDNSSTATTTVNQQADLAISKSGPPSASPGTLITYTVNVSNLGPSNASGVIVSDPDPPGVTFVGNSGACTTAYPCNLGVLASGASATINTTYSIPPGYASASLSNTASVASGTTDPNGGNNSSTVTTPVIAQADLSIVKSGPAFFTPGANVVYTIVVTNNGPLTATNTVVTDATPPGLTFNSNSGACTTPFPCNLGTLTSGQSATITTTFNVPAGYGGTTISNTASVSTSSTDLNTPNNTSTAITPLAGAPPADLAVVKSGPASSSPGSIIDFTVVVTNHGPTAATSVTVNDPTPPGLQFITNLGACTTPYPCVIPSLAVNASATITSRYFVQAAPDTTVTNTASVSSAAPDPNAANSADSAQVDIFQAAACPSTAPALISPASGATVTAPVGFSWGPVQHSIGYALTVSGNGTSQTVNTSATSATLPLSDGTYTWTVTATGPEACPSQTSTAQTFVVCSPIGVPRASVVGETTTGQTYAVSWLPVAHATGYELQESTNENFTNASIFTLGATSRSFTKNVTSATPFFYRVKALSNCTTQSSFSPIIHVAVLPVPAPGANASVSVPVGSTTPVTFRVFIPGQAGGSTSFIATADKPWLAVLPTSGVVPPQGMLLSVSIDPTGLPNGTWTGSIVVVYGAVTVSGGVQTDASGTTVTIPVSVSLVTPVTPVPVDSPSLNALVIPSVGHIIGAASDWRSDIRIANLTSQLQDYLLTFSSGSGDPNIGLKQTTISIAANATTALDDIVRSWYGIGSLGESTNGVLTIQPASPASLDISKATIVSSRTYNAGSTGTLGQFIPAVPFSKFLGSVSGASALTLQQLAQNNSYRTNVGVVEGFGKPASVVMSVFDGLGVKLVETPLSLAAGEQKELNSFLAQNGLSLENARIEVRPAGGEGFVTAYASVVDNLTLDPLLVSGLPLGAEGAGRYVVAGIAHVNTGASDWRSDLRVFNAGVAPRTTTLTFYPNGHPADSISKTVAVNPGEVKALDDVLASVFGLSNIGGALHVTTDDNTPLVVTARTYDQTSHGTVGQFIPSITPDEAVGTSGGSLQILHVEESTRYRTNVGIHEVTGHPATVVISVALPDSKVSPQVQLELQPYESIQLPILSGLGLGATYNARLSISVTEGAGRVTAYGSVIDIQTKDPTYIPAQK